MAIRPLLPLALVVLVMAGGLTSCDRGLGRRAPPISCLPDCMGRQCGEDGCGGICGTCRGEESCSVFTGECLAGGVDTVFGRLTLEARLGDVLDDEVVLDATPRVLPAHGASAYVVGADGRVIGARQLSNPDGNFEIPVTRKLVGGERLVVSTMWAPQGEVLMAVLRPEHPSDDAHWNDYVTWLWTWDAPILAGRRTDVTIREQDGSGALYLYLLAQKAMESVLDSLAGGDGRNIARLAMVWGPEMTVYCGTCYSDDTRVHRIEGTESDLPYAVFIDGDSRGSSAWGWPVVFHEMGHYVAFCYGRDNSYGGPHYLGQLLEPRFAWSEGWASFFGAMTASRWFGAPTPYYWDIQRGGTFWVDLERRLRGDGITLGMPRKSLGINQALDEFFVSAALWALWDGNDGLEDGEGALSSTDIYRAIGSPRFLTSDRGSVGSDLVDFLDAAICLDPNDKSRRQRISDDANDAGFPYDDRPNCAPHTQSRPQTPLRVTLEPVAFDGDRTTLRWRLEAVPGFDHPVAIRVELPDGARLFDPPPAALMDDAPDTGLLVVGGLRDAPVRVTVRSGTAGMGIRAAAQWPPPALAPAISPVARPLSVPFDLGPLAVTRSIPVATTQGDAP